MESWKNVDIALQDLKDIDMGNPENVSPRIEDARIRACLSRAQLADKIGKSRQQIYQYETGTTPPLAAFRDLAKVLQVSPEYLAFGVDAEAADARHFSELHREIPIQAALPDSDVPQKCWFPKFLLDRYAAPDAGIILVQMTDAAPQFGIAAGAWLLLDGASNKLLADNRLYAIQASNGVAVVRSEVTLAPEDGLLLSGGNGQCYRTSEAVAVGVVLGSVQISEPILKFVRETRLHSRQ